MSALDTESARTRSKLPLYLFVTLFLASAALNIALVADDENAGWMPPTPEARLLPGNPGRDAGEATPLVLGVMKPSAGDVIVDIGVSPSKGRFPVDIS